jgi:general nucleoside transport system ATP-binding protein
MNGGNMSAASLLEVIGLTKRFSGVAATQDVSFSITRGETYALLGENGAGKSTLVKMLYGLLRPDAGRMMLDGAEYVPHSPRAARALGVGMVFQNFSLFDGLTVTENVALAMPGARADRGLAQRLDAMGRTYGLDIDPRRRAATLSAGERQRVEILRCLAQDPRLIILDEPTSVLTPQEADALFATLNKLTAEGRSILYISHKLDEVRAHCQRATILRQGQVIATCRPADHSTREIAEMMLGNVAPAVRRNTTQSGPARLKLVSLSSRANAEAGPAIKDAALTVHAGEIVGIAGIAGNGQDALFSALSGEALLADSGALLLDDHPIGALSIVERRRRGIGFVPEDRLGRGTVPDLSLTENMLINSSIRSSAQNRGFIAYPPLAARAGAVIAAHDVKTTGPDATAGSLSGGNLQKFVVGRELSQSPSVLIVAQPTWGVDAGAQSAIHAGLIERAAAGCAILVISQDLDELFILADRIAVIADGQLSAALPTRELTMEAIGRAMGGRSDLAATRSAVHA